MSETTTDAFHRGRFVVVQPKQGAHRAGMDAMVVAAAVPSGFSGVVADLGAGAGAAGLAVLARCPQARAMLIEIDPDMAALARESLGRSENAGLSARATVIEADATLAGAARAEAGLADRSVDFVVMNPPFNDVRDRAAPGRLKARAHVLPEDALEAWLRTAAAMLKPGGRLAAILRPQSLPEILSAAAGRFGGLTIKPIHAEAGAGAIRIVVRATRGSRARLTLAPPLILRRDGAPSAQAQAISNGEATLFGD